MKKIEQYLYNINNYPANYHNNNLLITSILLHTHTHTGLLKKSSADCFQIRSIAQERLIKKLGYLTYEEIEKIKVGIIKVIGKE